MLNYPMKFEVKATSESGIQANWSTTTGTNDLGPLTCAIPPEFSGPGGGLSPEDLYALALENCFVATFKVFAEKSKLTFRELNCEGRLEVDRDEAGKPWMARFHLKVQLTGVEQAENARRLLEKTSSSCLVLNSVRTQKSFEFVVNS